MEAVLESGLLLTEAKYLTLFPGGANLARHLLTLVSWAGSWVRPHTAVTNQQLKFHMGISVTSHTISVILIAWHTDPTNCSWSCSTHITWLQHLTCLEGGKGLLIRRFLCARSEHHFTDLILTSQVLR